MRNNEDRLGARTVDADAPPQATGATSGASFSFSTPTEFVDLPSKGRYYPEGHPLRGKEEIEIRHMTAKDEDILASETLIRKGIAVERLLQNVLVDKNIDINSLLIGDKNALVVATRITGYGEAYETQVSCPSCSRSVDQSFDLSVLSLYHAEEKDLASYEIEISSNGTFSLRMPVSKVFVEVRLMNGYDEEYLLKLGENKRKKKLQETMLTDQLTRMIVSVDGDDSSMAKNQFIQHMPARDSRYLRTIYQKVVPDIDRVQEFICTSCGHAQELEVPFTVDFFWPRQ